jgi:hypothetical protein
VKSRQILRPRSSVVEHFLGKGEVTGSSPVAGSKKLGLMWEARNRKILLLKNRSVALMVEQQTPNLWVGGSSPSWPAINLLMYGL